MFDDYEYDAPAPLTRQERDEQARDRADACDDWS